MSAEVRGWLVGLAGVLAAVYLVVPAERARPDRVLLVALLLHVLRRMRQAVGRGARPRPAPPPGVDDLGPPDELDVRLARLESALRSAGESRGQFDRSVRPVLARLTTDRLYERHGIDAAADPRRARELMGEELWQITSTPADPEAAVPGPSPAELDRLVRRVETL